MATWCVDDDLSYLHPGACSWGVVPVVAVRQIRVQHGDVEDVVVLFKLLEFLNCQVLQIARDALSRLVEASLEAEDIILAPETNGFVADAGCGARGMDMVEFAEGIEETLLRSSGIGIESLALRAVDAD